MRKQNIFLFLTATAFVVCSFVYKSSFSGENPSQDVGLEIGNKAPEITMNNPDGKAVKLSSLKGYVVLIDFWASWCRPCRMENPTVVKAYNDYKGKKLGGAKGFKIFSVSLDTNIDAWKKAITDDQLAWDEHVCDLKGWSNEAAKTYGVNSIPTNFLIDGKGIIIGKKLRGPYLEAELEKLVK